MPSRRTRPLPTNWPTIRRRILTRDRHTCRLGYPDCTGHATEVDHITPATSGTDDHRDHNLQAACSRCHATKTGREASKERWKNNRTPSRQPRARRPERHPGMTTESD